MSRQVVARRLHQPFPVIVEDSSLAPCGDECETNCLADLPPVAFQPVSMGQIRPTLESEQSSVCLEQIRISGGKPFGNDFGIELSKPFLHGQIAFTKADVGPTCA